VVQTEEPGASSSCSGGGLSDAAVEVHSRDGGGAPLNSRPLPGLTLPQLRAGCHGHGTSDGSDRRPRDEPCVTPLPRAAQRMGCSDHDHARVRPGCAGARPSLANSGVPLVLPMRQLQEAAARHLRARDPHHVCRMWSGHPSAATAAGVLRVAGQLVEGGGPGAHFSAEAHIPVAKTPEAGGTALLSMSGGTNGTASQTRRRPLVPDSPPVSVRRGRRNADRFAAHREQPFAYLRHGGLSAEVASVALPHPHSQGFLAMSRKVHPGSRHRADRSGTGRVGSGRNEGDQEECHSTGENVSRLRRSDDGLLGFSNQARPTLGPHHGLQPREHLARIMARREEPRPFQVPAVAIDAQPPTLDDKVRGPEVKKHVTPRRRLTFDVNARRPRRSFVSHSAQRTESAWSLATAGSDAGGTPRCRPWSVRGVGKECRARFTRK
jgi:hypothetical protein